MHVCEALISIWRSERRGPDGRIKQNGKSIGNVQNQQNKNKNVKTSTQSWIFHIFSLSRLLRYAWSSLPCWRNCFHFTSIPQAEQQQRVLFWFTRRWNFVENFRIWDGNDDEIKTIFLVILRRSHKRANSIVCVSHIPQRLAAAAALSRAYHRIKRDGKRFRRCLIPRTLNKWDKDNERRSEMSRKKRNNESSHFSLICPGVREGERFRRIHEENLCEKIVAVRPSSEILSQGWIDRRANHFEFFHQFLSISFRQTIRE